MRVCPKCKYMDPLIWRQKNRRYDVDYTRLDEFERLYPDLAKHLNEGHPFAIDDTFAYRKCGRPKVWVERVWVELYKVGGMSAFRSPMEHHKQINPLQRRLLETESLEGR